MSPQQQTRCFSKPAFFASAGLLLWAQPAGDIDQLLQQLLVAGECRQCHVVSICR